MKLGEWWPNIPKRFSKAGGLKSLIPFHFEDRVRKAESSKQPQMKFGYEDLDVCDKAVNVAVDVVEVVENISTDRKQS